MSARILTLFGEEIIPEQPVTPPVKTRAKSTEKKGEEQEGEAQPDAIPVPEHTPEATDVEAPKAKTAKAAKDDAKINLPDDWEGDKKYYQIGEVADLFKVKTSHIRFWTNEFKIKVRTNRKGDRLYTSEQIKELRAIHHLVKERGFTLTGAKAKLKAQNKMDVETVDLKQSLKQLRNKLVIIRNQLVTHAPENKEEEHFTEDEPVIAPVPETDIPDEVDDEHIDEPGNTDDELQD